LITRWVTEMKIPKLSSYGIGSDDIKLFARQGENKNNPVPLDVEEITEVLEQAI